MPFWLKWKTQSRENVGLLQLSSPQEGPKSSIAYMQLLQHCTFPKGVPGLLLPKPSF